MIQISISSMTKVEVESGEKEAQFLGVLVGTHLQREQTFSLGEEVSLDGGFDELVGVGDFRGSGVEG